MSHIGNAVAKVLLYFAVFLFGVPAILFSVFVIGLTEDMKSGAMMLLTASVLFLVLRLNRSQHALEPRKNGYGRYIQNDSSYDEQSMSVMREYAAPPPLSDIYREMKDRNVETEELYRMIKACNKVDE
ncbi:hypothetical protein FHS16_001792 [Paenibacillus endophyticus]|uniref:Uncharacterized protein n=1 Tax=Paenibacillus endophyticus TaxID=1294268 RepID=A0A7W5C612_9BACL|nr:hypothetical protein [Paenibacillus endophyticus]MBB3151746.1 hypothetical protein [Paenibacillus endophyticus]